jgi:hypothetical protein
LATAQNAQFRVQVSPRIRKVAVFRSQQEAMFGQRALSQIVWRPPFFRISETRK